MNRRRSNYSILEFTQPKEAVESKDDAKQDDNWYDKFLEKRQQQLCCVYYVDSNEFVYFCFFLFLKQKKDEEEITNLRRRKKPGQSTVVDNGHTWNEGAIKSMRYTSIGKPMTMKVIDTATECVLEIKKVLNKTLFEKNS
ncbi:hypothetical protein RFI_27793 [Reticulomyxa filosa]|uniref:Uncharacterized protein n=1 Tax=Reticulomyxa filosa TaxID=46433 RepID=X6M802_RETFI|nr:hypothetical protein RFI_27793 [Reticulomyxa filosa]|eukprot:ETO09587.1 hypothetical protein RFI_27793 [Reticulomyxa filosa]